MCKFQSKYSIAFYDEKYSLVKLSWFTSSEELSEKLLKEEMNSVLGYIKKYQPKNILVDTTNFRYHVTQSIQNWIVTEFINKVFLFSIEKYAIVVDEEVYKNVSVQQIEEDDEDNLLIQYFIDEEEAHDWLDE